jgi:hypothetical protein
MPKPSLATAASFSCSRSAATVAGSESSAGTFRAAIAMAGIFLFFLSLYHFVVIKNPGMFSNPQETLAFLADLKNVYLYQAAMESNANPNLVPV